MSSPTDRSDLATAEQAPARRLEYHLQIKRVIERRLVMGIADGTMSVDGRPIYVAEDLRVGLFTVTEGF